MIFFFYKESKSKKKKNGVCVCGVWGGAQLEQVKFSFTKKIMVG